jgi:hypothetical protein
MPLNSTGEVQTTEYQTMNVRRYGFIVCLLVCLALPTYASAQVASSFEQLQVLVKPDAAVIVTDFKGTQIRGNIAVVSPSSLRLLVNGAARDLSPSDVLQITQRRADSLANGATIGAVAGGVFGIVGAILVCSEEENCGGWAAAVLGTYTALGAGVGVGVDALIVRRQTIYRAPGLTSRRFQVAPVLSAGRKGITVGLRF